MEDFIGYTIKEKFDFLLSITLMPTICLIGLILKFSPIAFPILLLCANLFYVKENRFALNRYKIEGNSLIIKKFTKTQTFNFDRLEKISVQKQVFSFQFPEKTIKINVDKNTSQLIEYFYKNNIEAIYNKKFSELDESKRLINLDESASKKQKRLGLIIIFFISVLCSIDLIIEWSKALHIYIFLATSVFFL